MTIAFLFPGQGAQSEGVLHQLPQHAAVTRTIEEANNVLGFDVRTLDDTTYHGPPVKSAHADSSPLS
jgi:malonyl CoA-acyl carrier protein transacylase